MKRIVIICDNCDQQIADDNVWRGKIEHVQSKRTFEGDLCTDCITNGAQLTNLPSVTRRGRKPKVTATELVQ